VQTPARVDADEPYGREHHERRAHGRRVLADGKGDERRREDHDERGK
jgi:hypothetical protein